MWWGLLAWHMEEQDGFNKVQWPYMDVHVHAPTCTWEKTMRHHNDHATTRQYRSQGSKKIGGMHSRNGRILSNWATNKAVQLGSSHDPYTKRARSVMYIAVTLYGHWHCQTGFSMTVASYVCKGAELGGEAWSLSLTVEASHRDLCESYLPLNLHLSCLKWPCCLVLI